MGDARIRHNEPVSFSHGTLELYDHPETMQFYRDFLGIGARRHHKAALNAFHSGEWLIACVKAGKALHKQGPENRWILNVAEPEDVDHAQASAQRYRGLFGIREIGPVETGADGIRFCLIQDRDWNWWEFRHQPGQAGRWADAAFARGDVV